MRSPDALILIVDVTRLENQLMLVEPVLEMGLPTLLVLNMADELQNRGGSVDDEALADRALMLRRWGRRSEPKLFGSQKGTRDFFSDLDGLRYDDLFIFDEVGWNFEPSELSAAFGCVGGSAPSGVLERGRSSAQRSGNANGRMPI